MKRRILIAVGIIAALTLSAGPFLRAERFRPRIHRALEDALHRRVDINGKVSFGIWNGPGFSISEVAIHEDPAVGIEPFAYVEELDASLNLWAILIGRWAVSTIVLDEPTVTLSQAPGGTWNVRRLLHGGASPVGGAAPSGGNLPEIRVRGGRINLKFGDTKSVLYFLNADLDLIPQDDGLRVRFSMEPARTDRPAQGFGILRGRGKYSRVPPDKANADLDLELERSALSEIATLLEGHGGAFRGFLAAKAKVQGPLDALRIDGSMHLEEIQRWDFLRGSSGSWPLQFRGRLNFPAGELDLETTGDAGGPFRLRLLGHTLLDNPSWGAIATCKQLPVSALRDLVQYFGLKFPERVALEGKLSGVLGFSRKHGLQGMVELPEAEVKGAGASFSLREARFTLDGEQFRLLPTQVITGGDAAPENAAQREFVLIEGSYSPTRQSFSMRTPQHPLPIRQTLAGYQQVVGAPVPLLNAVQSGSWRGVIEYQRSADEQPVFNGQVALRDATIAVEGLAAPVNLEFAAGSIQGDRITLQGIKGSAGGIPFTGAFTGGYRNETAAPRRQKLQLNFEELDATALEALFAPTIRRGGLLRNFSFRAAPLPQWLKDRHLDVAMQVGELWTGDTWLGSVEGRVLWDAATVRADVNAWRRDDSAGSATLTIQLARAEPSYRLTADVKNVAWKGGVVDGDVDVVTNGIGAALLRNARTLGRFQAHDLSFPTQSDFHSAAGKYELSIGRGTPQLKLDALEVNCGSEIYTGHGASEPDGRMNVDLASGRKRLRMSGTLWPFDLDLEPLAARQ